MERLFKPYTIDSIDYDINYMDYVTKKPDWQAKWSNYKNWFLNTAIPKLKKLDISGTMIFTGVWTGEDYITIKQHFPKLTLIGIDAVKYTSEDIIIEDVRTYLPTLSTEIDIMWNGIGPWPWNRESKQACFDYAKQYLRSGGLYIDHIHTVRDSLNIVNDDGFKILDDCFFMMEKL